MPKQSETDTSYVAVSATLHGPQDSKEVATSFIAGEKGADTHDHIVVSAEDGSTIYHEENANH